MEQRKEQRSDITKEMLIKKLRQLKRAKAPAEDGINNESTTEVNAS